LLRKPGLHAIAGLLTAQIAIASHDALADDALTLRDAAIQQYKIRPADLAAGGQPSCRSVVSTCYDKQADAVPKGVDQYGPPQRVLSGKGRQRWYQLRFDLGH